MAFIRLKQQGVRVDAVIKTYTQTDYDLVTEAGWYALQPFFNPADCNLGTDRYRGPQNKNHEILLMWQGATVKFAADVDGCMRMVKTDTSDPDGGEVALERISKKNYFEHRQSMSLSKPLRKIIYYRGAIASPYYFGCGNWDGYAKSRVFSDLLDVKTKRLNTCMGAMMPTIDLDFHAEDYPKGTRNDVEDLYEMVVSRTELRYCYAERSTNGEGIHICPKVAYRLDDAHNSILTMYAVIQKMLDQLEALRVHYGFNAKIDTHVFGLPSSFSRRRMEIKRAYCVKLPFFPTAADVVAFYTSPVVLRTAFVVRQPIQVTVPAPTDTPRRQGGGVEEEGTITVPPSVGTSQVEWEEVTEGTDPHSDQVIEGWRPATASKLSFSEQMTEIARIDVGFTRLNEFYKGVCRYHRDLVSPEMANEIYLQYQLNRTDDTDRRLLTFCKLQKFYDGKLDTDLCSRIGMEGWSEAREALEEMTRGVKATFTKHKGKGKRTKRNIPEADIAGVLFVLGRLQFQNARPFITHTKLCQWVKEATGKSLCRNAVTPIFTALQGANLLKITEIGKKYVTSNDTRGSTFAVPAVVVAAIHPEFAETETSMRIDQQFDEAVPCDTGRARGATSLKALMRNWINRKGPTENELLQVEAHDPLA